MNFKIPDTPEELFRKGGQHINSFNKWMPTMIIFFLIGFFALTSFYSVDQGEVGVIRRFGKYSKTTQPRHAATPPSQAGETNGTGTRRAASAI